MRAQRGAEADTSSLAPEAPAKTLNKSRNEKLRNGLESLGDANINNKFETINTEPGFLSAGSGSYHIYIEMIYTYIEKE